ncbi:TonB-dependent receptor domain-containing protein [Rheinheimera sp.]|uniref:TonB-dependent receptor domain-containing protein n=1 Tax=Rheinheimera sp. TaxID=1869214 RepID=UPI0027BB153D|nr:TonB-dependent receptor [Rheinheimera sp.]
MFNNHKTAKAVRIALAFGAASTAMFSASNAFAAEEEDAAKKVERIEITGSRIKRVDVETASPVQITSSEEIKLSGFTRIEDLMNSLPQIEASETSFQANGASGNATLDLRGMGSQRTLVLVNGRRLQAGGVYNAGAPDVNQIPSALVERVEVLTGGGSATYGADAVAGVVNFVMKKDFEGIELTSGVSGYQHNNDNKYIQDLMDKRKFSYPKGDSGFDGKTNNIDLTVGGDIGTKGHITAYATWRNVDEMRQGTRDYSSCALNDPGTACGGSGTAPNPNFYIGRAESDGGDGIDYTKFWTLNSGSQFIPSVDNAYNYAPVNHFMRPDERYTFGAFANYEINEYARPYVETSFMNDRTNAQIAESGTFFGEEYTMDINNPLFSDAQRAQFRSLYGADTQQVNMLIGKRNTEGGARASDLEFTSFRIVTGIEGIINDSWSYDASFLHGVTSSSAAYLNDFFGPRIGPAIGAVAIDGVPNTVTSDLPYNVFQFGGVTAEAADALKGTAILRGVTSQTVLNGFVSGDLGFNLPSHSLPVAAVLGLEHRQERFGRTADEVFSQGSLLGQGGPTKSLNGGYTVKEVFGELSIPLVEDAAIAKDITVGLGGRYSDYSTSGSEPTYKVELDWTPIEDWKIRASYNRAVRAPNVGELFAEQNIGLWGGIDPCAGAAPALSAAQCANTGVTAAQYGAIAASPAGQYNQLAGGNPELTPEIADTYSVGLVANPFEGFNFSVDYWNIELEDVIGNIAASLTLQKCAETGAAVFCDNVKRGNGGSLWIGESGFVQATNINLANRHWRGVDLSMNYETEVFGGKLTTKLIGSRSMKKYYTPLPGDAGANYECSGNVSTDCFAQPKWRHTASVSYTTGDWWTATAKWRYFGAVDYTSKVKVDKLVADGISSQSYLDLVGSFDLTDNVAVLAGVNNVLDKEPPMVGLTLSSNANAVAGFYDTLGRYLHASVTVKF